MSNRKILIVARGKISGTYADNFHHISQDGKIGYDFNLVPTAEEKVQILKDVRRHRKILMLELQDLLEVEEIFNKE